MDSWRVWEAWFSSTALLRHYGHAQVDVASGCITRPCATESGYDRQTHIEGQHIHL